MYNVRFFLRFGGSWHVRHYVPSFWWCTYQLCQPEVEGGYIELEGIQSAVLQTKEVGSTGAWTVFWWKKSEEGPWIWYIYIYRSIFIFIYIYIIFPNVYIYIYIHTLCNPVYTYISFGFYSLWVSRSVCFFLLCTWLKENPVDGRNPKLYINLGKSIGMQHIY